MPLSRQILHRVQALLSRAARGFFSTGGAAEEESAVAMAVLSARRASKASASTWSSMMSTFASSPIAPRVRPRASIAASLPLYHLNSRLDYLRKREESSMLSAGETAHERSFLTRTATAVAASSGNGNGSRGKRKCKSSSDRRRSSSTSTAVKPRKRMQPPPPSSTPPSLSRRGRRQWRTLLEDEHPLREEDIPREIRAIMSRLREAGHASFIVGGAVRDALLGILPKDWDVLTTAGPMEISKIIKRAPFPLPSSSSSPPFSKSRNGDASSSPPPPSSPRWPVKASVNVVGTRFPVAIVKLHRAVVEVSTLPGAEEEERESEGSGESDVSERSGVSDVSEGGEGEESEGSDGETSSSLLLSRGTLPPSLFSALSSNAVRRDFTVNALYFDPGTGALHDPTGLGVADALSAKAVRVASALGPLHSFSEDPARGIRAVRLASRARLKLTPAVEAALVSVVVAGGEGASSSSSLPPSPLFTRVPSARRAHELAALFAHGGSRRALALLWRYGLLDLLLPEHARWLEEARVPRRSVRKNRRSEAAAAAAGEEDEEAVENDDDDDDNGGDDDRGSEADSSAAEAPPLSPLIRSNRDDGEGEEDDENTPASRPPPPPPPKLRSLPGVDSLAALDVAASASSPAPPALWAAALAMPLVASAALAEQAKRRRKGGAGLGAPDEGDRSGDGASVRSDLYLGPPLSPLSAPLAPMRRFRALVHAAVESMGGGGHHHVPRAIRAGAEALILRAAAAELDEAQRERQRGGGGEGGEKKTRAKTSLGGGDGGGGGGSGAYTHPRRQQQGAQGERGKKAVWATVLAGAGKWAAIAEGMRGRGGGRGVDGGGEKSKPETKKKGRR